MLPGYSTDGFNSEVQRRYDVSVSVPLNIIGRSETEAFPLSEILYRLKLPRINSYTPCIRGW